MEMPTPCQNCDDIFDLLDGVPSTKWYPNTVICRSCGRIEDAEIEKDEEIEDLRITISDAEVTIEDAQDEIEELHNTITEEKNKIRTSIARLIELGVASESIKISNKIEIE